MKNHTIYVVATYALLILAAPLIVSSVANAQAVNCPAGYVCTPINPTSPSFNTSQSQGFFNAPGAGSASAPNYTYTQPQINPSVPASSVSPVSRCYVYNSNLSLGSRGSDVVALQNFLLSKGYQLYGATGYFGSQTAAALRSYQAANGISEGGYLGPITRAKLNSICPIQPPTPQFPGKTTHSADTNQDWRIDQAELEAFQALYNYTSGTVRTGEYSVGVSIHGDRNIFVPGPGLQTGPTHSGDSNHDWHISLLELTRVIELRNASGGYMVQAGTEDGFAPINAASNVSLSVVPIGTPTITMESLSAGWRSYITSRYTATFNAQMTAIGADAYIGLPGASFPAVSSGSYTIYKNGLPDASTNYNASVMYSQPSGTALEPNYASTFVIKQNQTVTVPITIVFTVDSPGANIFGVRLNQINWFNSGGKAGTDLTGTGWSTPGAFSGGGSVGLVKVFSPNGGEVWQAGTTQILRFTASGASRVYLALTSTPGGPDVVHNLANIEGDPGQVSWAIPSYIEPGRYYFKVGICAPTEPDCTGSNYSPTLSAVDYSDNYFTITNPSTTGRPLACGPKGDLNGNGWIDQTDYDILGKVVAGTLTSTLAIADLNGDGRITISDWVLLGRYVAYLDSTFPACGSTDQPSITSIVPNSAGAQTYVTIYGKNLASASSVSFYNSYGQFVGSVPVGSVSSNGSDVSFSMSSVFVANTPPGTYQVSVVTSQCKGGCDSNRLPFKIIGTKTEVAPPYISSVTASQASTGIVTLNVVGSRLNGGTLNRDEVVYIDGQVAYVGIINQSTDGTSLSLSLSSLSAGNHTLKIVNSSGPNAGTSNVVSFNLATNSAVSLDITQYKDGVSTSAQAGSSVYVLGVKLTAGAQGFNTSGFQVSADNSSILSNVRLVDGNNVYYPRGLQGSNTYDFYFSGSIPAYGSKVYLMKADIPANASGRTRFTLNGLYHSYGSSGTVGGAFFGVASSDFTVTGSSVSASADIRVNGSDSPAAVANNSTAQVSWTSVNTTYCTAAGSMVSLVGGGTWGNNGRLGTSGSAYVTTPASGSSVYFDIQCYKADGTSVTDRVYLPLSSAQPTPTPSPVTTSCTDSDGGVNIDVKGLTDGRVNGIGSYFNDSSVGSNGGACSGTSCTGVAEGYCSNGTVTNKVVQCPSGYSIDGACMAKPDGRPLVCGSKGDIDGNRIINSVDYELLGQVVAGNRSSTNDISDLNGDSSLTVSDWVLLGRYVNNLDNTFPACSIVVIPPTTATCTDSDGGQNPSVAGLTDGRVNGLGSYFNDASVGSNGGQCSGTSCTAVAEGYCSNGQVTNTLMQCSTGYSVNGACSTKPSSDRPLVCGSLGDLDGNGVINSTDYDILGQVVAGNRTASQSLADLNGNGAISVTDWVLLGNYIAGTATTFSGCPVTTSSTGGISREALNASIWDAINEYLKNNPQ